MAKWSEEHPFLMKTFEIAMGTAFSIASTAAVAFITGKMNEKKQQPKPKKNEIVVSVEDLEYMLKTSSDYGDAYGENWWKDPEKREEFNSGLDGSSPLVLM